MLVHLILFLYFGASVHTIVDIFLIHLYGPHEAMPLSELVSSANISLLAQRKLVVVSFLVTL